MDLAYIPSPSTGVIELGPIPLRGYAFCILIGVFVAVWIGGRRWVARGGLPGTVADITVWAVPFGLVGGRLYHIFTTYEPYFGKDGNWVDAFRIWEGGLGIWGAIALGAVGAWIGARRRGVPLPAYADAVAPGIAIAQAIGRWGNWFNQELYGKATDLPWAVKIDENHTATGVPGTFHPTFLYESLWCVGVALLVIWADRRFKLGHGRVFALYVAAYTVGRAWIEYLRIDEAHHLLGLRFNVWTSIVVFIGAVAYMIISSRVSPGRETVVEPAAEEARALEAAGADEAKAEGKPEDGDEAAADGASEPDPEPDPEPESGPEPDPEPESGPDPEPESGPDPEPEPGSDAGAEADGEPGAEPAPAAEADAEPGEGDARSATPEAGPEGRTGAAAPADAAVESEAGTSKKS